MFFLRLTLQFTSSFMGWKLKWNVIATQLPLEMEETRDETGRAEQRHHTSAYWASNFVEKFGSVSLDPKEETLRNKELTENEVDNSPLSQTASQILWRTGTLSEPIPNGFYSVVPVSSKLLFCPFFFK